MTDRKKRYLVSTVAYGKQATTVMTSGYQSDNGIPEEEKQYEAIEDWTIPEEYYGGGRRGRRRRSRS